jgi:predicted nuclease of restriction endonuclease-like RecB superfamily
LLTADLVRVRKKGTELSVSELGKQRPRALELAQAYVALAEAYVGEKRSELEEAFGGVDTKANERKLALGLQKLVEDRLEFDVESALDPRQLRGELFLAAAAERRSLGDGERLERAGFLGAFAGERGLPAEGIADALYADLRQAQVLKRFAAVDAEVLVDSYDLAQKQAVLLRAVDVIADVRCRDAYAYRQLFRKLKFFRLMHRVERHAHGGYRIVIDGPFSMFSSATKYGLELALCLPSILACDQYRITAALRWGKERTPLTFKLEGRGRTAREEAPAQDRGVPGASRHPTMLPDEVAQLNERFAALESEWAVEPSSDILEVPGSGLCVPDLRFSNRLTGEIAYLEVLGYWSRDAVWKRVELAQAGLRERVLFAVSSRLRVSEEVLDEASVPSRLYVYKGTLSAKEILRRLA